LLKPNYVVRNAQKRCVKSAAWIRLLFRVYLIIRCIALIGYFSGVSFYFEYAAVFYSFLTLPRYTSSFLIKLTPSKMYLTLEGGHPKPKGFLFGETCSLRFFPSNLSGVKPSKTIDD
jgi:hypothetical protein